MMRFTTRLGAALTMAAIAALGLTALGQPGRAAAQDLPGGTWGLAQAVNLTALVPAGLQLIGGNVQAVSCASPGNCGAIGDYSYIANTVPKEYPFVMSETGGTWGPPTAVSGITSGAPLQQASVSCAAPGECAASWDSGPAYLIDESGGVWGQAQQVTMDAASYGLGDVSCPAPGDCTALGGYTVSLPGPGLPFVMESSAGTWGAPQEITGVAALSSPSPSAASLSSLSCASAGNCVAGGTYYFTPAGSRTLHQPFLAIETDGSWGPAQNVAGVATLNPATTAALDSVSCGAPGDCAAIGWYTNVPQIAGNVNAWVANESGGVWGPAQQLSAPAASSNMEAQWLSCPAQDFCATAGTYFPGSSGVETAFTAIYADGAWTAQDVPGLDPTQRSYTTAVSCSAPGYCTVSGQGVPAGSGTSQPFLADDVNGTWASAQGQPGIPGGVSLSSGLSCTAPGYCTAAGQAGTKTAFTMSEATASSVMLQASAATVTYGAESGETLTATVTSPAGGTPTGTVTVSSGSATVCTITLASGSGTCTLTATQVPVGTAQLTATYNGDTDYAVLASAAVPVTVIPPLYWYVPDGPVRILDTRHNTGGYNTPVGANKTITLQVTGKNGVPATGVSAVVLNVTAVSPTTGTYLTVYPDGQPLPVASSLNAAKGQTIAGQVTVPVGADGKVDLYNYNGTVDLVADLAGYYTASGGSGYTAAGPVRVLDTRHNTGYSATVKANQMITLQVTGKNGVPASGVSAVVLNVTAVSPTTGTYVTVFPGGQALPVASSLNAAKGQTIANLVTVPVGAGGKVALYNYNGTVNLVADLAGYYTTAGGSSFEAAGPVRILDTRHNTGGHSTPVGANQTIKLQVAGVNGVPAAGVSAVVLNVTAVNPTAGSSYITVYPDGQTLPVASNLNFTRGQTIANQVIVPVGTDGEIDLYNYNGTVDLIADLAGYYTT